MTGVNTCEQKLRRACADLANELAYTLQADGQSTSVRRVHAAAEKKIDKAQSEPSVGELMRRRRWLKKCLRARRLALNTGGRRSCIHKHMWAPKKRPSAA